MQHLIWYPRCSSTASGKIFFSIGEVISSTVVKALSIITVSTCQSQTPLDLGHRAGQLPRGHSARRRNDRLQSTSHLFKSGQAYRASLETPQSFVKCAVVIASSSHILELAPVAPAELS